MKRRREAQAFLLSSLGPAPARARSRFSFRAEHATPLALHMGPLPRLAGLSAGEFVSKLAARTRREASMCGALLAPSTLDDGAEDPHRQSWTVPWTTALRYRELAPYLRALDAFALAELARIGVRAEARMRLFGDVAFRDASVVVYEAGQFFGAHGDAEGLRSPRRAWTFVAYLKCPSSGGALHFPELGQTMACAAGHWALWPNYAGGRPTRATVHEAGRVGEGEEVEMFTAVGGRGRVPVRARKVVVNLWFDE